MEGSIFPRAKKPLATKKSAAASGMTSEGALSCERLSRPTTIVVMELSTKKVIAKPASVRRGTAADSTSASPGVLTSKRSGARSPRSPSRSTPVALPCKAPGVSSPSPLFGAFADAKGRSTKDSMGRSEVSTLAKASSHWTKNQLPSAVTTMLQPERTMMPRGPICAKASNHAMMSKMANPPESAMPVTKAPGMAARVG